MDINETIKAFWCCTQIPPVCSECPQRGPGFGIACKQALKDSVSYWLNMAKEDVVEPRVMELEEAQGADYCWYENKWLNICLIVSAAMSGHCYGRQKTEMITFGSQLSGFCYDDEYGKTWRCWTSKPTDAQREATAWEPQQR